MKSLHAKWLLSVVLAMSGFITANGYAASTDTSKADAMAGPKHRVVIQVSTASPEAQTLTLNNAANLQSLVGEHNIKIEIVAFGPGLSMLTTKSHEAKRVESMAMHDITFSACHNTMMAMEKKTGHKVVLLKGVGVVPSGVARIMELQEQGYSYIRP